MSAPSLATRSGRRPSQRYDELMPFLSLLRQEDVRRYLEIGARHGDTFHDVMTSLPPGSLGVAVDLGGGPWGTPQSVAHLRAVATDLRARGYDIHIVMGDSTSAAVRASVQRLAPFDAALIDADHRYAGVKADWLAYGPLARLVAFHDIDGSGQHSKDGMAVEVPRLWQEIKPMHRHREFISDERGMGIGVLWR